MMTNRGGIDETSRYVRSLVFDTEQNCLNLRNGLSSFLRAQTRLRGKSQKLSNVLRVFAERETTGIKNCLTAAAEGMSEIEKYRKEMQDRIDVKSREPLGMYAAICDGVLDDLKVREVAIRKEHDKQLALDRIQVRESGNRTKISQGQIELSGANHEANTSSMALAETVERFELKKVGDVRACLQEFVYSQMFFYSKSLEVLTDLMALINSTDFDADIEEVCDRVRPAAPKVDARRASSRSGI